MNSKYKSIFQKSYAVYVFVALASIALSIWIPFRETVINPDAICYLLSSEQIGIAGLKSAMHLASLVYLNKHSAFALIVRYRYKSSG